MLADIKRLQKILIYKALGTEAIYKRWQCRRYNNLKLEKAGLRSLIDIRKLYIEDCEKEHLAYIVHMYLKHRFNYLGSGWVGTEYGSQVIGVEEQKYAPVYPDKEAYFNALEKIVPKEEWHRLCNMRTYIAPEYSYIHWARDYKSGYTWRTDYIDEGESTSLPPGADVKTVWELGRLEFVLQLAIAAFVFPEERECYIREFKNVMLDFMCSNPIGVGPNWVLPMETAIRSANLLLAYDIIMQLDKTSIIKKEVSDFFTEQIYKYGKFIFDNLEKDIKPGGSNGNHYYSNIIGLLYISVYLNEYKEAKMWFRFAKKEFEKESIRQFYEDGGNVEASTAYHRFMTEMMVFGAAIIKRKQEIVPKGIKERIVRAAFFLETITGQDGNMIQIGDNDSGRFVNPVMYGSMLTNQRAEEIYENLKGYCKVYGREEAFFDENNLDAFSTICFARGMYFDEDEGKIKERTFEESFIEAIAGEKGELVPKGYNYKIEQQEDLSEETVYCKVKAAYKEEKKFTYLGDEKKEWGYFPDFGLFFVKGNELECYVYTGGRNGRQRQGHSHNDLLHCELSIDGEKKLYDKGTYLYIPNPYTEYFRGYRGHSIPDFGREPRKILRAWVYEGEEHVEITVVSKEKICLHYVSDAVEYWRDVEIGEKEIRICDYSNEKFLESNKDQNFYSNGYGKLQVVHDRQVCHDRNRRTGGYLWYRL